LIVCREKELVAF